MEETFDEQCPLLRIFFTCCDNFERIKHKNYSKVCLSAALIAGRGYQVQSNVSRQGLRNENQNVMQWTSGASKAGHHRHKSQSHRLSRRQSRISCPNDMYSDPVQNHCCKKCPAGEYKVSSCTTPGNDSSCAPCSAGTFLAFPNWVPECKRCDSCDEKVHIVKKNCTATKNTECACRRGSYSNLPHNGRLCRLCKKCENREVIKTCSETEDAQCGKCHLGFYEEKSECHPCWRFSQTCINETHRECTGICRPGKTDPSQIFLLIGIIPLLLLMVIIGGVLLYHHWRKRQGSFSSTDEDFKHFSQSLSSEPLPSLLETFQEPQDFLKTQDKLIDSTCLRISENMHSVGSMTAIMSNDIPGPCPSLLQQGATLYSIIDAVPIRRWKEFIRTLGLKDAEIERVEMEFPNFRDQQYEMLKRWHQQKNGALLSVYHVLEKMDLSGCAEELKGKLE
ncbi:tumor necrosis factor receptor superfamily member 25 [Rhinatrema bivittatum]|uniref:tumor necrosis factor receptor superfamily member 25 n=1 Tax=Rhinatrema bivittatum TaxID=194408 RepID=UPI00112B9EE5|nr:tumor necrosis factor receptor superfamily member 25 [Rhinatrema bivittatum]